MRLLKRTCQNVSGNTGDLDIHLQGGDAIRRTGHLEIHIAEVVFAAEDIGKDDHAIALLNQSHCNAGHMIFKWHACIH